MHEKGRKINTAPENEEKLREAVLERYSRTALEVLSTGQISDESCCKSGCCSTGDSDQVTSDLYSRTELGELPTTAVLASLGCVILQPWRSCNLVRKALTLGAEGASTCSSLRSVVELPLLHLSQILNVQILMVNL
jgi:hypothetical protein